MAGSDEHKVGYMALYKVGMMDQGPMAVWWGSAGTLRVGWTPGHTQHSIFPSTSFLFTVDYFIHREEQKKI